MARTRRSAAGRRRRLVGLHYLQRQQPVDDWLLCKHGHELGVNDVDLVYAAVLGRALECLQKRLGDLGRVLLARRVGEAAPLRGRRPVPEPVPGDALAARYEGQLLDPLLAEQSPQALGLAQDVGVVAPGRSRGRLSG